ncbi:hypothetical protein D0T12_27225 [Actinomadura spongiicola]|uniref:Uncharacterized protein n=1 Tax=Actinomadura spongiicola TaxID=2303421 RepID=A0A372GBH4_9ACTN|nr:hypothetical protein D0T12_27225 [Actinomadura spongiicola]
MVFGGSLISGAGGLIVCYFLALTGWPVRVLLGRGLRGAAPLIGGFGRWFLVSGKWLVLIVGLAILDLAGFVGRAVTGLIGVLGVGLLVSEVGLLDLLGLGLCIRVSVFRAALGSNGFGVGCRCGLGAFPRLVGALGLGRGVLRLAGNVESLGFAGLRAGVAVGGVKRAFRVWRESRVVLLL